MAERLRASVVKSSVAAHMGNRSEETAAVQERGILYVATGAKYIQEGIASARSVKACMPDVPILLMTDDPARAEGHFDFVERLTDVDAYPFVTRIQAMAETPFEKTLYLDTDTYLCGSVADVFDLLDRFEIAVAHAPLRWRPPIPECPPSFPQPNCGVIAFRKTPAVEALLARWLEVYRKRLEADPEDVNDQTALRRALYESDVRMAVLPPEYNCRISMAGFLGGKSQVRLLHGRHRRLDRVARRLNAHPGPRVFLPHAGWLGRPALFILSRGHWMVACLSGLTRLIGRLRHLLRLGPGPPPKSGFPSDR